MINENKIKIFMVDDHPIFRQGVIKLITKEEDIVVVGEADNGRSAIQLVVENNPDIVILDITMPGLNGVDTTYQLKKNRPEIKIIALSMYSDRQHVSSMIKAGVSGYVTKTSVFEELLQAIRDVYNNKLYLSTEIDEMIRLDFFNAVAYEESCGSSPLSIREREVLQLIAEGYTTKEISGQLFISVKTVESHRTNIMTKLNLFSIAELTKYAIQHGLTTI
jgi:DNA-binding NarL/FixJ family response regulator